MSDVKVIPFINQFVDPARLEVLIDWTDEWHDTDPFVGAKFFLAHTPGSDTPKAPKETAYTTELEPLVIREMSEQLRALGLDENDPAGIARLAPAYVARTVSAIDGSLAVTGAMSALTMSDLTDRKPQLFSSANFIADLERWTNEPPPAVRIGGMSKFSAKAMETNPIRDALSSVIEAANSSKSGAHTESVEFDLDTVVRNAKTFGAVVAAAEAAGARQSLEDLERAVRERAIDEQLVYAEALRRDQIYSRVRSEREEMYFATMTSAEDVEKKRNRRADVRRVSRDEPVIGAMFHVLRWFELPDPSSWDGHDLWVLPFRNGAPMSGYTPIPTRAKATPNGVVTILRRDEQETYFAQNVTVRQIAPALLLENAESDPVSRLRRMIETGQSLPPLNHGPVPADHAAFALNTRAHEPEGKAAEYIHVDAERELADAAESVRRNMPPFDAVGITWERALTASVINDELRTPYHTGFKGYRIDAREVGAKEWKSLCTVEREVFDERGEAIVRTRRPREGYVIQPVQNHSADKTQKPTVLTMPADFIEWGGGSTIVPPPFDRLGESLAPPTEDGPLVSLREIGTTSVYPRYGREYEFRVRGVGLAGTGPDAGTDPDEGARDSVLFKRGVPMDAPATKTRFVDLLPLGDDGKPVQPREGELTPDVPLLATSANARVAIETSLPLAHWRVAMHARGLTRDEQRVNGAELERACARFVRRSRENWRRRIAGMPGGDTLKPAAHLSAVDPHCGSVEVTTRAWFPFSSNTNTDRHLIIGREVHPREDIRGATFSRLVTMGEDIIETDRFDDEFLIDVESDALPSEETADARLRVLAGFHCRADVAALWSDDANLHYRAGEGRRRWTRQIFAGRREERPIGGTIENLETRFTAGNAALSAHGVYVDAAYSAIFDLEKERDLVMPQPPRATGTTCEIAEAPPAHAEPVRWRKIFFDRDCTAQPTTDDCRAKRAIYRAFVAQQLGKSVDASTLDGRYRNQLAVCLEPLLVPRDKRSLVLPVFTFPETPTYEKELKLPSAGCARSIVVKLGELGSAGVKEVRVDDGGSGYITPPAITFIGGDGLGALAHAVLKNGAVESIVIDDGGRDYASAPSIEIAPSPSGGRARATVTTIGETVARKLPWVDSDVVWTVRLAWHVPLKGSVIARPLELAAVREFKLYRREMKPGADPTGNERPLAVLTRPGSDVLEDIDLDHVEFTWVDAITDRDRHEYEYSVVAVPEDRNTFAPQTWHTFKVDVPDSRIAARPESARFLPMLAQSDARSLAIYFSDPDVRGKTDHVTYFIARAADDPMLTIEPKVKAGGSRPPFEPNEWPQLFPAARVPVTPVPRWDALLQQRAGKDGIIASPVECTPEPDNHRGRVFLASSRVDAGPLIASTSGELGNPFFKLHLHAYDDERFPALAHTAASEAAESDWLQFYPDDLRWASDAGALAVASPWGGNDTSDRNLVWYRFHFFAPATDSLSFHVSTFYSHTPALQLDATRRSAILDSLKRFTGHDADDAHLFVRAEEGLLAETYALEEVSDALKARPDPTHRFVVLRSTPETKEVRINRA